MWQMTLQELTEDSCRPEPIMNPHRGVTDWLCPICGATVGILSDGTIHEEGWLYKRDVCRNGHTMDWNV